MCNLYNCKADVIENIFSCGIPEFEMETDPVVENSLKEVDADEYLQLCEKISEQQTKIEHLLLKNKDMEDRYNVLKEQLFKKEEHLKILSDRVKHLQDTNCYRNEVVRLEGEFEKNELSTRVLKNELENQIKSIKTLEERGLKRRMTLILVCY